ncbi:MAG: HAMP domain-containing histidine kinase [Okeania sp. SIO3I5]|uniref:sensor histidine kinase n=1 Tax=Okeania sp. SIO3I5 TaxID=2607805 RepID=UPI0013BA2F57|nr:HAMP domain-containing sensor histidine kinase [Okeania sp. SIO3I5]NEQ41625.1 HAMP domain-containing histidine kinase [Okeania sp. SIO3I5]
MSGIKNQAIINKKVFNRRLFPLIELRKNIQLNPYPNLPLREKISLPFVLVFLGIWISGTLSIGYFFTRYTEQKEVQQVKDVGSLILRELQQEIKEMHVDAKLLVEGTTVQKALLLKNRTAILQELLPLRTNLSLDLIQVVDKNGNQLADLRSSTLYKTKIANQTAISQVINGVDFSSIIATEKPVSSSILIGTAPVKSNRGIIGGIIIGRAVSDKLLAETTRGISEDIIALHKGEIIASSFPKAYTYSDEKIQELYHSNFKKIKIGSRFYITKTITILGLDATELELVILSCITDLEATKQKFWILIGSLSLLGSLIAILVGYLVSNLIAGRIATVTHATEELASGDLKMRLPITYNDEVDKLAKGFNLMAEKLEDREQKIKFQVQQLEITLKQLSTTQSQLVQTEKMSSLGRMVAGIAHELNNPVSFIYGNIEYAFQYFYELLEVINVYEREYPEPTPLVNDILSDIDIEFVVEDLHKLLNSMKSGADRISNIVRSLRTFSRLDESGKKSVDIHENIESTLSILQHRFSDSKKIGNQTNSKIQLVKEYGNLPLVTCHPGKLNQVFLNIIENAIDALEISITKGEKTDSLQILIKTEVTDNNSIKIKIADNGCGMTEEVKSKIFDPFMTTKPVGSGTGLGLSISYSIVVDEHHGKLSCISAPGEGTELLIEIPIN